MENKVFEKAGERMKKAMEALRHELARMRTGRASLAILDGVHADYYGASTPLNQLATLSVPDPRTIAIQPWDLSAAGAIEKAIQKAGLGLNPVNDGKVVRIPIPPLNEERRRELVKVIHKHGEECKVSVRNARREANEELKGLRKTSAITEDEERRGIERVQKLTDETIRQIDGTMAHKEKDVMQI